MPNSYDLVTVCIPTYNGSPYLEACVSSVINQTYKFLEILIIDDGSSDGTMEVISHFTRQDKRVKSILNIRQLGLPRNWNKCLEVATGQWVKFLFQDDLLERTCIEKMLKSANNIPIIVCGRKFILNSTSEEYNINFIKQYNRYNMEALFNGKTYISPIELRNTVVENLIWNFIGEPTAVIFKKKLIEEYGNFNTHLIQICDIEFWIRVASHTGMIFIPEPLVYFRLHDNSTTIRNLRQSLHLISLDQMVCAHEFLFHPHYKALRDSASKHSPPINLNQWFASRVKATLKKSINEYKTNNNMKLLKQYNSIADFFPGFKVVRKWPLSLTLMRMRHKLTNFYNLHLSHDC